MKLEILKEIPQDTVKGHIVFVHGASHGAWCWQYFLPWFAARGYESVALSLPGHAGSEGRADLQTFGLADYTAAVENVASPYKGDVILVGHSMGGAVVQKLIYDNPKIAQGAVLVGTAPPNGVALAIKSTLKLMLTHWKPSKAVIDIMYKGKLKDTEFVRRCGFFCGRITVEQAREWQRLLQIESKKALGDVGKLDLICKEIRIPVRVLASTDDIVCGIGQQQRIAREYGADAIVLQGLCHDMMLDPKWELAAEALLRIVEGMR
jgi:pimeloyl-ACP methyl ester carboxylesterase